MTDERELESFADAPVSLGEARAVRGHDAAAWSPREMLIDLLRDIDSGKIVPTAMVVAFNAAGTVGHYRAAVPDRCVTLGLLELAKFQAMNN